MIDRVAGGARPPTGRGAGRVQVVRARAARRLVRLRRRGVAPGASFLRRDGSVWTTDKDGIILAPARLRDPARRPGTTPSAALRATLVARHGDPAYARDRRAGRPASRRPRSAALSPDDVTADRAGRRADHRQAHRGARQRRRDRRAQGRPPSPRWFAARPSGTEDVYKIYAESFRGPEHLAQVQAEAKAVVDAALGGVASEVVGDDQASGSARGGTASSAIFTRATRPASSTLRLIPFTRAHRAAPRPPR